MAKKSAVKPVKKATQKVAKKGATKKIGPKVQRAAKKIK